MTGASTAPAAAGRVAAVFDALDDPNKFNRCFRKLWVSPDGGSSVLASYADAHVRQFAVDTPAAGSGNPAAFQRVTAAPIALASPLIDAAWCPFKRGAESSVFVSTCKGVPLQLWDANDGELRASYRCLTAMGEPMSAQSVVWARDGTTIVGGYGSTATDVTLHLFDVSNPSVPAIATYRSRVCSGLVGSLAELPALSLIAAGHLETPCVELVDRRIAMCAGVLRGHTGGVTHIAAAPGDGRTLVTGARNPDERLCVWDLRNVAAPAVTFRRRINGPQFVGFDVATTDAACAGLGLGPAPAGAHTTVISGGAHGMCDVFHVGAATVATRSAARAPEPEAPAATLRCALPGSEPSMRWETQPIGAVAWGGSYLCIARGARVFRRWRHPAHRGDGSSTDRAGSGACHAAEAETREKQKTSNGAGCGSSSDDDMWAAAARMAAGCKRRLREATTGVSFESSDSDGPPGAPSARPSAKSTVAFLLLKSRGVAQ